MAVLTSYPQLPQSQTYGHASYSDACEAHQNHAQTQPFDVVSRHTESGDVQNSRKDALVIPYRLPPIVRPENPHAARIQNPLPSIAIPFSPPQRGLTAASNPGINIPELMEHPATRPELPPSNCLGLSLTGPMPSPSFTIQPQHASYFKLPEDEFGAPGYCQEPISRLPRGMRKLLAYTPQLSAYSAPVAGFLPPWHMQTPLPSPPTSVSSQASTVSSTESTPSPFDGTGRSIHIPEATKEDEKLTYTRRATWPRRRATKAQLDVLESYYKINPKPSKAERVALGDVIGKQPESIRFWFQNQRAKQRKEMDKRYLAQRAILELGEKRTSIVNLAFNNTNQGLESETYNP